MTTFLFMPESAYGPTNNCIGIGNGATPARPPGRVRRRGVVGGQARAARLRRGPRRPRPADQTRDRPMGEADAGQFWNDFINETAPGVPQADDRAARVVHAADVAGADRRRQVLRAAAARDRRPPATRRDHRGQRQLFPGLVTAGAPFVRIMSCNPLEMRGPDVPPVFCGLPGRRPDRVGRRSAREYDRTHRRHVERLQRLGPSGRRARPLPDLRVHPRRARTSTCTSTPRRSTTRTRGRSMPPGIGSTRQVRTTDEPTSSCPSDLARAARRDSARSTCRSARSAAPTST